MSSHAESPPEPPPAAFPEPPDPSRAPGRAAALATALLVLTALPAIALALPDTSLNVLADAGARLGLDDAGRRALLRASGLTLPALVVAVPAGAVAARRLPARLTLLAGLALLLGGVLAAPLADSVALAGTVRAAQGAGAGLALPATLVLVWERRSRLLAAVWAGTLAAALLTAMPLALRAVPAGGHGTDWHTALAPLPWPAAAAVAAALACLAARTTAAPPLSALRHAERGLLVLPIVPAAGLAFLAVLAAHRWSPGGQLAVAAITLVALAGLALAGGGDAIAGSPHGCAPAMLTAGLLGYPVAGPLAGLTQDGAAWAPLLPFAAGGAAALLGALLTVRLPHTALRGAVLTGHGLIVAAVLLALATAATGPSALTVLPLLPLGAGLGVTLAAALRDTGVAAALFGLALCFPALLTGQLMVLSLQMGRLQRVRPETVAEQAHALTAGYRMWLVAAGVTAGLLAAVCARTGARHPAAAAPAPQDG
ncbi:hypothetical protein [Actinomadura macrotermitis]|uniref:MFS transporter n=1 Tax=Actinomadura macrotermitis TaxID=2585200 RepID=A0A7K0BYG0_9ACTN|nr:hypothetical protein [Actinomadura macrotermitis]MQY06215.1 hypothetical protein [Actinomadura macrotermitis]